MEERRMLAYHEAGHIVVGHVVGLEVEDVTIISDGEAAGLADVPVDFDLLYDLDEGDAHAERQLSCYFAGVAAEEILTGEEIEFRPGGEYGGDWNGAADCVVELAGNDGDLQLKVSEKAFSQTRQILHEHWSVVKTLAEELLSHGALTAEEVKDTLNRLATPNTD